MDTHSDKPNKPVSASFAHAIVKISRWPAGLILGVLLVNAIFRPYSDLIHDARLYSVQVLERVFPGRYADDLYLRYGSQDKFSVFSSLAAPITELLGIRIAFFLMYLLCNSLLLYAAYGFFVSVSRHRLVSSLAIAYIAVNPVVFAGLGVFQVNETMLTPRLASIGFVLIGLRELVANRVWRSALVMVPALLMHPVMSFGGALVWLWCFLSGRLRPTVFHTLIAAGIAATAALLCCYPLASRLLGAMDPTWREIVQSANYYATPVRWMLTDWFQIATAFGIVCTYRYRIDSSAPVQRVLSGILFVGSLAVLGGAVAPLLPYALPFQGQPYRALWILQLTQIPLLLGLCYRALWQNNTDLRNWSLFHALCFAVAYLTPLQVLTGCGFMALLWLRYSDRTEGRAQPRSHRTVLSGMVACFVIAGLPFLELRETLTQLPSPLDALRFVGPVWGPFYTTLAASLLLVALHRFTGGGYRFAAACLFGFVTIQTAFLVTPALPLWGGRISSHRSQIAQLRQYVHEHATASRTLPTIYWTHAQLDDLWVDLQAKSFFVKHQTAGNMFNRGTAIEGNRRARLVARFEYAEVLRRASSRHDSKDWKVESLLRTIGITRNPGAPTATDLLRLCREPIDFVIVPHKFEGLYSRQVGGLFLYDCERIREQLSTSAAMSNGVDPHRAVERLLSCH